MRSIGVNLNTYDIEMGPDLNLTMVEDFKCINQDVLLASQMLRGENPYNTTEGVPYMETVFQQKKPFEFEEALRAEIEAVPGVRGVQGVRLLQVDEVLQYEATVQTDYGTVKL